jgi:hypothetical protein
VRRVECVGADVAGAHPHERDRGCGGEPLQPIQVGVDGGGLPAGVGEDRRVERHDLALDGQQQTGGALDAGAQAEVSA